MNIYYKSGYKYQLAQDYSHKTAIEGFVCGNPYCILSADGTLIIRAGYAWDGPSGPAIDTKNFMRGSLVHDALYQFLREAQLPQTLRKAADQELDKCLKEDGMTKLRRWWVYTGLRFGAADAAEVQPPLIHRAP